MQDKAQKKGSKTESTAEKFAKDGYKRKKLNFGAGAPQGDPETTLVISLDGLSCPMLQRFLLW